MGARRNSELTALEAWAARRAKYPSTAHCLHPACVNSCDYALARVNGQFDVPAGGQVEVPTLCGMF
ncbi:hypothetical protein GOOTI_221_00440 [Gordonia otitidis NBRC 100426]|uniref:Uncharacterized protein n=1 Tax=Gordonia otitidis (strain DSM 44809 / CCUG 52243 / JCM 12355 / NBRC 100426 / IFM 10032) TaxID=1108044 RepID=H5TSN6_GORO1|nr:hypothetical protein GOOTI_221_00440 [Gordonia otitidis NBRC 100426]